MSVKHYDIAIIGGSLSARIAAVLLAKSGNKVLFIREREATAPAWFHSSLFLEKLLGVLGGRACFTTQHPIQVISRHARVTLQSDVPLSDELQREFGAHSPEVIRFLNNLSNLGNLLEKVCWENGGLPWPTLKGKAAFRLLCLRHKLKTDILEEPIVEDLAELPDESRQFLIDLLQGLTLLPIDRLTVGQAALLWCAVNRPENLKEPDFSLLLDKRFSQFHGLKADLEQLVDLDFDGKRWTGGHFKEGSRFEAGVFLLGDRRWHGRFKNGKTPRLFASQHLSNHSLGNLSGQLSPLLGNRVICGGDIPVQLTLERQENTCTGQLTSYGLTDDKVLRSQLEPVLPFTKYRMKRVNDPDIGRDDLPGTLPSVINPPFQMTCNLYCADNTVLLPGLGGIGAALVGWSLFTHLGSISMKQKV